MDTVSGARARARESETARTPSPRPAHLRRAPQPRASTAFSPSLMGLSPSRMGSTARRASPARCAERTAHRPAPRRVCRSPGGDMVDPARLCGTVRYNWRSHSSAHMSADTQSTSADIALYGGAGAVQVGLYRDPSCPVPSPPSPPPPSPPPPAPSHPPPPPPPPPHTP
eukprot:7151846-Prymnesium_polylepis.1